VCVEVILYYVAKYELRNLFTTKFSSYIPFYFHGGHFFLKDVSKLINSFHPSLKVFNYFLLDKELR
jgi:hypothetical protein